MSLLNIQICKLPIIKSFECKVADCLVYPISRFEAGSETAGVSSNHAPGVAPKATGGHRFCQGFTLIELLVVIGIIGLLLGLSGPIVGALKGAGDLGKASVEIQGLFEQARSYAMANNTYVYVGLQEIDVLKAQSSTPTNTAGVGRVALALVASKTGLRPYMNTPSPLPSSDITPLGKLRYFDNLHITNSESLSTSGKMNRPSASTYDVADLSTNQALTTFQWPLTGTAQYNFTNMVVEFSPQGTATIQTVSSTLSPPSQYLEIALLPTRGNTVLEGANQAAIQINGITGAVTLYRP